MKNHAFVFSALFICGALFPLPEFLIPDTPQIAPTARHLEEIGYDSHSQMLYLFGGAELDGQTWSEPKDFFGYKNEWKKIEQNGPCGRRGHAMVYDESAREILVIGGVAQIGPDKDTVLFDTWSWSNGKWNQTDFKCPVKEPRAVYDPNNKSVLVYGDAKNIAKPWRGGDERKFELWEFKSQRWTKLSDNGPTTGPFPLAYNRENKSLSALEWIDSTHLILWQWRNKKWYKTKFDSDFPEMRGKYSFTYSQHENALFLFGGTDSKRNLLGDFWKYDGVQWTKIEATDSPSPRASLSLVDAGEKLLLYGGVKRDGLSNELWEFRNNRWKKL